MSIIKLRFEKTQAERLDAWLSAQLDRSRAYVQNLCEQGLVKVGEKTAAKSYKLCEGDFVEIALPKPQKLEIEAQAIPLDIIYEDDDLIVVNKPKGMVVHPAPGNYTNTLVNALLSHCGDSLSGINGIARPGIVHRIDKNTSGLLMVAKNDFAHAGLSAQLKDHSFERVYECVVCGHLKEQKGTVNAPIGRHPQQRVKMAVTDKNSKPAVTHYTVLEQLAGLDYVSARLETGRTHQIRVHMAYLGHPILNDNVYGAKTLIKHLPEGQVLHAKVLGFTHPRSGNIMRFESNLPEYFEALLKQNNN